MEAAVQEFTSKFISMMIVVALVVAALAVVKILLHRSLQGRGAKRKWSKGNARLRKDPEWVMPSDSVPHRKLNPGPFKKAQDRSGGMDLYELYKGSVDRASDRNYSEDLMDRGDAYVSREYLMTPAERSVYQVLEKAYGENYRIFCQVRVVDVIQPNTMKYYPSSREYISLFRQLSQWHFDYVLCGKEDFKVFCALELDDASHERPDRKKRDKILDQACRVAGLRLERMRINHSRREIELVNRENDRQGQVPAS